MTPTDPDQAREALAARMRTLGFSDQDTAEIVTDLIANRNAVLRALGLHEERAIDKPGMRGINPQRRWVSGWEDYTDE